MMVKDLKFLQAQKSKRKISMVTCYDYPTAVLLDHVDIDVVLIGDSVGTNVLGYHSEKEVTIEDILHHVKAVRRGISKAYVVADLPYQTYQNPEMALQNAIKLQSAGADGIKLEGAHEEIIHHLTSNGFEVWAHLGYNAQFQPKAAIQGKSFSEAKQLIIDSIRIQQAGAKSLVLELVPEEVSSEITKKLRIPTIGIGAGRYTDGQVLVVHDLLGITPHSFRHAKKYANLRKDIFESFQLYIQDLQMSKFPTEAHFKHMHPDELKQFKMWLEDGIEFNQIKNKS
ncbi:3-methyl-2-oxobutanoate hydroxymethyltransferase [Shimazuella sp. AN120528]|uniref:3-methyl-2-oxobutanoate hydroxymethyltransferase n=1 Tax=Shimazuella soli TaxID=1892854 RepID=UPI001F0DA3BF|nr:3-methyl-2-oxobutanoate hydroxymethyltransferase [Shimazuella soli]MCH5585436.1 3-methyl-2-oxobutanoate hydroxymethyltransferase [Shimazuella soli]